MTATATATAAAVLPSTIRIAAGIDSSFVTANEIALLIACRAMQGSSEPVCT